MRLFSSESVTEGHPDKVCDQISDSILDAMLAQDPLSRVAVETMVTTGLVHVAGEVSTESYVDIPGIIRSVVTGIGYTSSKAGFDGALDSSVLIRTAAFTEADGGWVFEARAGAGIVADSDPVLEGEETEAKIAALARALEQPA